MSQSSLYLVLTAPLRLARLLVGCLVVGFLFGASSATAQYRFDTWSADGGLPQNSVYAILQTRDGYLWFTTLDGLVRYDGVRFKIFDKGNTKGIGTNRFNRLCEDNSGNLWAGTEDGGLTLYRQGEFRTYTIEDGLPSNWVINIQNEPDGYVLILTTSGGVRWKDDRFTAYEPPPGQPSNRNVYIDRAGERWFIERSRLYRVKDGRLITYPVPDLNYTASYGITCMHENRQGYLWVGADSGEIIKVKDGGGGAPGDRRLRSRG